MAGLLQWYMRNLRRHPILTNLGSGVVLMTAGDVSAQAIERHHNVPGHALAEAPSVEGVPTNQRLHMKPYGRPIEEDEGASGGVFYNESQWQASSRLLWNGLERELKELDYFRTATMIGWSAGYVTPFFLYFFHVLDRIFPKQTPLAVGTRVFASFVISIPTNAIFFIYGTSVHHVAEWIAVCQDWREEVEDCGQDDESTIMDKEPPFDFEMMVAKCIIKVKSELVNTVSASAKAWIPINLFNFALVPSHLRPLVLMTASVFWNCYLSLVQHRDVALPSSAAEILAQDA